MKINLALIAFIVIISSILTLSHALLRSASAYPLMELSWFTRVFIALFLYGVVFVIYAVLLRHYELSILFPLYTAFSLIGVFLVGVIYFEEHLSSIKIIGAIIILIGSILIAI
jgi:multidrug transporter EmrE-like cation transporter